MTELFFAQVSDPFRIVLAIGLVLTTFRTEAATGFWLPLGLGVLFIAALIPMTMGTAGAGMVQALLLGLVSTALIVAAVVLARALVLRAMGR